MVAKDPPSPFGYGGPAPTVTFGGRRSPGSHGGGDPDVVMHLVLLEAFLSS